MRDGDGRNQSRFYSTYEELKLKKYILCDKQNMGFYSTYEELKPQNLIF